MIWITCLYCGFRVLFELLLWFVVSRYKPHSYYELFNVSLKNRRSKNQLITFVVIKNRRAYLHYKRIWMKGTIGAWHGFIDQAWWILSVTGSILSSDEQKHPYSNYLSLSTNYVFAPLEGEVISKKNKEYQKWKVFSKFKVSIFVTVAIQFFVCLHVDINDASSTIVPTKWGPFDNVTLHFKLQYNMCNRLHYVCFLFT